MRVQPVLLVCLFLTLFLWSGSARLVELNERNFESVTAKGKFLVEFYANWCPHCQKLAPVVEEAAILFDEVAPSVTMAIVDCADEEELCRSVDIANFPSFYYLIDGTLRKYYGGRNVDDFVAFAEKAARPAIVPISSKTLPSFLEDNLVNFVVVADDKRSVSRVDSIARQFVVDEHIGFASTSDISILDSPLLPGVKGHSLPVLLMRNDNTNQEVVVYGGSFDDKTALFSWIEQHTQPVVLPVSLSNWEKLITSDKLVVLAALKKSTDASFITQLTSLASDRIDFTFGYVDVEDSETWIQFVNRRFGIYDTPDYVVINMKENWYYSSCPGGIEALPACLKELSSDSPNHTKRGAGANLLGRFINIAYKIYWTFLDNPVMILGMLFVGVTPMLVIRYIDIEPTEDAAAVNKED